MTEFVDLLLEAVKATDASEILSPNQKNLTQYSNWLETLADTASKTANSSSNALQRRPRAYSEPVVGEDPWMSSLKGAQIVSLHEEALAVETELPHASEKFVGIYNRNGRIGMYTREERNAIIRKFREKRMRRVWTKKIRYSCRKNLADRRVRIKGRFVKGAVLDNELPSVGELIVPSSSGRFTVNLPKRARSSGPSITLSLGNELKSKNLPILEERKSRAGTMTTSSTEVESENTLDADSASTSDSITPLVSESIRILASAAAAAEKSSKSDSEEDEAFDEESEEQFLRDFLSGKLSLPHQRKRRHTMA